MQGGNLKTTQLPGGSSQDLYVLRITPVYIGHLEGVPQPQVLGTYDHHGYPTPGLGDLLVINHILTGMILQVTLSRDAMTFLKTP